MDVILQNVPDEDRIAKEDLEAREFTARGFAGQDKNLLLSASAGSGKTRTLVERIVERTEALPEGRHIDSFLVTTFTEAAASELREKISAKLGERVEQAINDGDIEKAERLYQEKLLTAHAIIGTIDSFMLKVVKEHFAEADIPPVFAIDDEEVKRISLEATEKVLEEYYGKKELAGVMNRLVDAFSDPTVGDNNLKENLFGEIIKFCNNMPNPNAWLDTAAGRFETGGDVRDNYWYGLLKKYFLDKLNDEKEHVEKLLEYAKKYIPDGAPVYKRKVLNCLECDGEHFSEAIKMVTADDTDNPVLFEDLSSVKNRNNIPSPPKNEKSVGSVLDVHKFIKDERGVAYDYVSASIQDISAAICNDKELLKDKPPEWKQELFLKGIRAIGEVVKTVTEITKKILDETEAISKRRGIFSFSQIEHFALRLLCDGETSNDSTVNLKPSAIAKAYRKKFTEILIDEYQDTNMIQEEALYLISGNPDGEPNQVMVGDVKQSIYKFRNAKPALFLGKFDKYKDDAGSDGILKTLSKNYRSRKMILDAVNAVFFPVMTRATVYRLREGRAQTDLPCGRQEI